MLPRLRAADTALHNGDPAQRIAMWARDDPVTLFGAAFNAKGWSEIEPIFRLLGSRFSDCSSWTMDVVAAGVSGSLGYIVSIEHTTASVAGAPPSPYSLRVTTIFRREDSEWRVVHRHGDPYDPSSGEVLAALGRAEDH
jgi:ketosteroid isomerase-like protein